MATTVRLRGGQRQVQDGPFADTKELLGGLFLIDVPDLDAALVWAARCPAAATGSVEVRPQLPPPPGVARLMSGDGARGDTSGGAAHRAVELAARTSYGRLVAVLAARSHDVAAAEDALGDAFAAALAQWPEVGVPASPEGWLVAAARRRLADGRRRTAVREAGGRRDRVRGVVPRARRRVRRRIGPLPGPAARACCSRARIRRSTRACARR
jgi:hypothetical protein